LYVHDRQSGQTQRLSYPWQGGEFTNGLLVGPTPPKVSQDGRFVVFSTNSTEIHPDTATSGGTQVYLLDRQSGQLDHLSATPGYSSFNTHADLSANGRYVAWASRKFSFQGPANPSADMRAIWVLDRQTGQKVNVTTPLGPLHEDGAVNLDLSPDGSVIAFTWRIADPASPIFARPLLYAVELLGSPVPQRPAAPVPTGLLSTWALMGLLVLFAYRRFRYLR
jgi:Tol biopolymer transport system component